jgi:hypothetical protein
MERVTAETTRRLTWFVGRAREEFEDIVAEARSLKEQQESSRPRPGSESASKSSATSKR